MICKLLHPVSYLHFTAFLKTRLEYRMQIMPVSAKRQVGIYSKISCFFLFEGMI